jgi:hypothetical protein
MAYPELYGLGISGCTRSLLSFGTIELFSPMPSYFPRFLDLIQGSAVIVGKEAWLERPIHEPIPGVKTIVLSTTLPEEKGIQVVRSVAHASIFAQRYALSERRNRAFVLGGNRTFRSLFPILQGFIVARVCEHGDIYNRNIPQGRVCGSSDDKDLIDRGFVRKSRSMPKITDGIPWWTEEYKLR